MTSPTDGPTGGPTGGPTDPAESLESLEPGGPDGLTERVADAVREVPGVADLHTGVLDEVVGLLPGRRAPGVRLRSPGCDVHVVLEWGAPVHGTTELVRDAVRELVGGGPVDVTVEDVAAPAAAAPSAPAPRSDLGP